MGLGLIFSKMLRVLGLGTQKASEFNSYLYLADESFAAPLPRIQKPRQTVGLGDPRRREVSRSFNASQPVERRAELHGREEKLEALFEAVVERYKHAIVSGARGSGKTSLVRIFADHADHHGCVVLYTTCDPGSSLAALLRPCLAEIPPSSMPRDTVSWFQEKLAALADEAPPREIVDLLSPIGDCRIVIILDEFDRADSARVRADLAMLMKQLSDASIPVQLVAVGIGSEAGGLIGDHPSLRRHLSPISIGRIDRAAVSALIAQGAGEAGLAFDEAAVLLISDAARGSPYHIRLFCAHAGYAALRRDRTEVDAATALRGMISASSQWALVNPEDAACFAALARVEPALLDTLARLARIAATEDSVSLRRLRAEAGALADEAVAALGSALLPEAGDADRLSFADSTAPQFFLAMLLTSDHPSAPASASNIVNIAEPARPAFTA